MAMTLGIDVACRAAHQATFAVGGQPVWRGRKFLTRPAELGRLWDDLDLTDPGDLTVVVEHGGRRSKWPVMPMRASWTSPSGLPLPSAARWILQVIPPRTRLRIARSKHGRSARNPFAPRALIGQIQLMGVGGTTSTLASTSLPTSGSPPRTST